MSKHRNEHDKNGLGSIVRSNVVGKVTDNPLPDMSVDKRLGDEGANSEPVSPLCSIGGNVVAPVSAVSSDPRSTPSVISTHEDADREAKPSIDLGTTTDMLTGEPMTIGSDNRVHEIDRSLGGDRQTARTPAGEGFEPKWPQETSVEARVMVPSLTPPASAVPSHQTTPRPARHETYEDWSAPSLPPVDEYARSISKTGQAASALFIDITPRGFVVAAILAVLSVDMVLSWSNQTPYVPTQVATVSMDQVINMGRAYFKAQGQDTMRAELSTAMLLDVATAEMDKISKSGRFIAIIDADAIYGGDTYDISAALFNATIDASPDLGSGQAAETRLARTKAANAPTLSLLGGE